MEVVPLCLNESSRSFAKLRELSFNFSLKLKTLQAVDGIPHSRFEVLRRPDVIFCSKPQRVLAAALEEKVVSGRVSTACVHRNLLS